MITDAVFIGIGLITLTGAVLAVSLKNVFYNALALILCLFGVAALFIYLNAEFLAVMEVIIYIGAISIAIIFAIMLSSPMFRQSEKRSFSKLARSAAVAAALFAGLWMTLSTARWPEAALKDGSSLRAIGRMLLGSAILPFETVSIILLIAIIGALLLSSSEDRTK